MIGNIQFLFPDEDSLSVQRREFVSQYITVVKDMKYVFGWDQPLMSYYLQVHDLTLSGDEQIVAWLGATADTRMYEVEDLVRTAKKYGLDILYKTQVKLFQDKDDGI
jgi:hypothetical protein